VRALSIVAPCVRPDMATPARESGRAAGWCDLRPLCGLARTLSTADALASGRTQGLGLYLLDHLRYVQPMTVGHSGSAWHD